jgi:hypothetical protein
MRCAKGGVLIGEVIGTQTDGTTYRIHINKNTENNTFNLTDAQDTLNTHFTPIQSSMPTVQELKVHLAKTHGLCTHFIDIEIREELSGMDSPMKFEVIVCDNKQIELTNKGINGTAIDECPTMVKNLKINCWSTIWHSRNKTHISQMPNITRLDISSQQWEDMSINIIYILSIMKHLVKFDISKNNLCSQGTKSIAKALENNQVMTELNISGNLMGWTTTAGTVRDTGGVIAICNAILTMTALTSLNILNNNLLADGGKALAEALKGNNVMQELNLSFNDLGYDSNYDSDMSGVIAISDAIPTMGALVSANILYNGIGVEQAKVIADILKEHPTLKSLCGNKGDETELNMAGSRGKRMGADGAIMLAPEIVANGALTSLDMSNNNIGLLVPPKGWTSEDNDGQVPWIHSDGRRLEEGAPEGSKTEGTIAISNAISANGALTSLNISNNRLTHEDIKNIQSGNTQLRIQS